MIIATPVMMPHQKPAILKVTVTTVADAAEESKAAGIAKK